MSITQDEARQILEGAFIAAWESAHANISYFIEGVAEPDMTKQKDPFATFDVSVPQIVQSALNGNDPPKRYYGNVAIGLFVPQGLGTQQFFLMQKTLENALSITIISGITLEDLKSRKKPSAIGWQGRNISIPYRFDSLPE